ncbi:Predicted unusual protein kinase [Phaffia rhodozyma]|uniref:Predicted unusual protein kinase n=1 Tax=Phaffia rhodozyma TaxID=264483 RepID=A0A0F7SMI3_PHARH|nr:Predicted unusual protein kinase [Phaffia rhodozyma]
MVFPERPLPKVVRPLPSQKHLFPTPPWIKYTVRKPYSIGWIIGGTVAGLYIYDNKFQASTGVRTIRTLWTGLVVTLDFKWNFSPGKSEKINELHERTATRVSNLINENAGLYIKLGQQLGTQAAVLPPAYRKPFSSFSDAAPVVSFDEILPVFIKEFGAHPDELFDSFERTPIASASIAQVHKAKLKDGREVAVKVQKPAIEKQVEWDLWSYRTMMWCMQAVFDYPTYFVASYVSEQMRRETDFRIEADNSRRTDQFLSKTPSLQGQVYIPKVYPQYSGERIMTMEYVNGCRINDREQLDKWDFRGGLRRTMDIVLDLFACQTFEWGWVHCDPHPGNILVRPNPENPRYPQVILIDHGLYIPLSEKFRTEYSALWRSLFVLDIGTIEKTARAWGVTFDSDMFASAILLRPTRLRASKKAPKSEEILKREQMTEYELQVDMKRRLKALLENEQLIPRELIFLVRAQRMLQAANQGLGSPSNRVNITAKWAAKGYALTSPTANQSIYQVGLSAYLRDLQQIWLFEATLKLIDIGFWTNKLYQWVTELVTGKTEGGLEERLQKQFEAMAKEEFGIDLDETAAFEG